MNPNLEFFSNFIHNPRQIAAIAPSSRHVVGRVIDEIDFNNAKCIVEYGPGTGSITNEILKHLSPDGKLICLDVNQKFCRYLAKNIKDSRLAIINDSAVNIGIYLKKFNIKKFDYALSSIPFTFIKAEDKKTIIRKTRDNMAKGGKFIVYQQYSLNLKKYLSLYFKKISTIFEVRNIPPTFIYKCEKS